jgi:formylglycine-generating enzyme required for sulfatase activity
LQAISRDPNARYVIPTEDEWYKAAYYDPTRGGNNYWLYPMRTDGPLFSATPPGTAAPNAAVTGNFIQDDGLANAYDNGYAVTGSLNWAPSTNYLTDVGAYAAALSYYGTLDQGGNLMEWTERLVPSIPLGRGLRGGSWRNFEDSLRSTRQGVGQPVSTGKESVGLRLVEIPEPATIVLIALAAAMLQRRRLP